ncbi:MAG: alpha/beta hydrolase [Actinobacteria bacterium]|nr:alpha/beta hydrolase [Actinomycetota bacterium]MCA1721216.1 alpha/beta hydrolase [Actinomycetota bacterium]
MDVETNGVRLHVEVGGQGPPVLLVHGFPDSHRLWRHQVAALRGAGYSTIAPDLRGFGASDRPTDAGAYAIAHSVFDLHGVLEQLGHERVHLVGHDWGAVVAWAFAAMLPERVDRLVTMSVGHPAALGRSMEQREKAWYMLLFQFEEAEELLRRDDWALFRGFTRGDGDQEQWLEDLSRPGALTAALGWYRDNVHPRMQLAPPVVVPPVAAPTLGMWSTGDHYLVEDGMKASGSQVTGPWRYERVDDASHWLQVDQPHVVNDLILEHLQGAS